MSSDERPDFLLGRRSIEFIPHELRHGKASDLMYVWFGANMELPVVAAGAATVAGGLSLGWTVVGIIVGVLLCTLFMAAHSAQGPHLGLPQIQSRAQFGYYGAAFPLIFVVFMYLGFYAAGVVLGAQALAALVGLDVPAAIVVLSAASAVVAIFGYNLIHRVERFLSFLVAAVFGVLTVLLVALHHSGAVMAQPSSGFALGPFLLAVSVPAISQLAFAPYVADYARYLPERTSVRSVFWYTYAGVGVSGAWLMIFGAALRQQLGGEPVAAIGQLAHGAGAWFAAITELALILGVLGINALNVYGAYMSALTFVTTFTRRWRGGLRLRLAYLIPVAVVSTYFGFLYQANLLDSFETFLMLILALMSPWTAINLADYYLVRHGRYDVTAIHEPAGIYGRASVAGLTAYLAGFVAQLPFMANKIYTGPIAQALHGGDVSWIVGVLVSGGLYLATTRKTAAVASEH